MATRKAKESHVRSLSEILEQRPTLKSIADVAEINYSNDQVWFYWCSRLGYGKVYDICKEQGGGAKCDFASAHHHFLVAG